MPTAEGRNKTTSMLSPDTVKREEKRAGEYKSLKELIKIKRKEKKRKKRREKKKKKKKIEETKKKKKKGKKRKKKLPKQHPGWDSNPQPLN